MRSLGETPVRRPPDTPAFRFLARVEIRPYQRRWESQSILELRMAAARCAPRST